MTPRKETSWFPLKTHLKKYIWETRKEGCWVGGSGCDCQFRARSPASNKTRKKVHRQTVRQRNREREGKKEKNKWNENETKLLLSHSPCFFFISSLIGNSFLTMKSDWDEEWEAGGTTTTTRRQDNNWNREREKNTRNETSSAPHNKKRKEMKKDFWNKKQSWSLCLSILTWFPSIVSSS